MTYLKLLGKIFNEKSVKQYRIGNAIGIAIGIAIVFAILFTFRFCNQYRIRDYFCIPFGFTIDIGSDIGIGIGKRFAIYYIRIQIWSNGRPIHYDPDSMGWGFKILLKNNQN